MQYLYIYILHYHISESKSAVLFFAKLKLICLRVVFFFFLVLVHAVYQCMIRTGRWAAM